MKQSTFYDACRIRAKYLPADSIAMIHGNRRITWRESFSHINRLANALKSRGVKKGDKVGLLFHNSPEFSDANIAIQALGAVPVPINYRYVADELEFVMDHCDACCLIFEAEATPVVEEVRSKLSKVHTFISNNPNLPTGTFVYDRIIQESRDEDVFTDLNLDDVAVIIYTGGTTGRPKGVMLTYRSMLINQISVVNLLMRLLPPISQLDKPDQPLNAMHRKLLSFIGDVVTPMRTILEGRHGRPGPILCLKLSAPQLADLPTVTAMMVGDELKLFAGMHPNADLVLDLNMGEDYRALSDQGIYNTTLKGKLALLPIMIRRMLNGEMRITGKRSLLLRMATAGQEPEEKPPANLLAVPPLFHLASYAFWLTFLVHQQGAVVFPVNHSFDSEEVLGLLEKENVSWTLMVPVMWKKVVAYPKAKEYNLSNVKIALSGAALLPAAVKKEMLKLLPNALVIDGFGQTEMAPVTSMKVDASPDEVKDRSVGKILDGVEVKVVDDEGEEIPDGQIGELMYRSKTIMKGYYKDDAGTKKVLNAEGWFRSGDLAYRGPDGEIYTVERRGECINSGGEKIYPIEVEEIIAKHPTVDSVCVVGVPDEEWGESATAVVVCKAGMSPADEDIIAWCAGKMAGYKKPKRVFFTDSLPLSPVGKVLRVKVRQFATEKIKGQ